MLYLFFSRSSKFSQLFHREDPSNHCKDSPCVFNFSFLLFDHSFVYRSSSWRLYMTVHTGFNSFSKCSLRFFSEEFKHSSSCNSECSSAYLIFWGGIMSFLIIWIHVSWFPSCQEWDILNPSISSLESSGVIFHLKPSQRIVANYGAYNDPSSSLSSRWNTFSSPCSNKYNSFTWVADCHLIMLRCLL